MNPSFQLLVLDEDTGNRVYIDKESGDIYEVSSDRTRRGFVNPSTGFLEFNEWVEGNLIEAFNRSL